MNRHIDQCQHEARKKRDPGRLLGIVFAAVLTAWLSAATEPEAAARTLGGKRETACPERGVPVRFRLHDERAHHVSVAGSFSQWEPRYALYRDGHGDWTVTVRLNPGRYEYLFVIDGRRWIADPAARVVQDGGFGGGNSVLVVTAANTKGGAHAQND